MRSLFAGLILCLLSGAPSFAQSPEALVRWIYASRLDTAPGAKGFEYLAERTQRDQFLTPRLIAQIAANESYGDNLAEACWDFAFDIPGQDFNAREINTTLQLGTQGDDTRQSVTARFSNFGQPAEVTYLFLAVDGFWRIDDIAGPGWRVSQIPCQPKARRQTDAPAAGAYCFATQNSQIRLLLDAKGNAEFQFDAFQTNGHHCGASGLAIAAPDIGGWRYSSQKEGYDCQLEIRVTADQGIELKDPEWNCKAYMCGARAVIDGIAFSRQSQIDCAGLRMNQ